jgi:hypothetical protein
LEELRRLERWRSQAITGVHVSKVSNLGVTGKEAKPAKETAQQKPSLLTRVKKMLPWGKKSKKKDLEIYPLF